MGFDDLKTVRFAPTQKAKNCKLATLKWNLLRKFRGVFLETPQAYFLTPFTIRSRLFSKSSADHLCFLFYLCLGEGIENETKKGPFGPLYVYIDLL
jgi:hypothetical protein